MIVFGRNTSSKITKRQLTFDNVPYHKSEWMLDESTGCAPHVYSIEMSPGMIFKKHHHIVSEFQIVIDGSGSLEGDPLSVGSIHYAAQFTPYGPLIAGSEGMSYLTLRAEFDSSVLFDCTNLTTNTTQSLTHILNLIVGKPLLIDAGTQILSIQLDANESYTLAESLHLEKRILVVYKGSLAVINNVLLPWEQMYIDGTDTVSVKSGDDGVQFVILQF